MQMLRDIQASVYDPKFYDEKIREPLGRLIKFYLKFALLVALVSFIVSALTIAPRASRFIDHFEEAALTYFPADLEIKIIKGEVSINKEEPYVLRLPKEMAESLNEESPAEAPLENLAVIDTRFTEKISVEDFEKMRTVLFVGKTYMMHYKDRAIVFQDFSEAPDFTFDHAFRQKVLGFAGFMPYFIPILCFAGVFSFVIFQLIWAILLGFIFWLVSLIARLGLSYTESYKAASYAALVPIMVGLIAVLFGLSAPFYILSLATLAIAFLNAYQIKNRTI